MLQKFWPMFTEYRVTPELSKPLTRVLCLFAFPNYRKKAAELETFPHTHAWGFPMYYFSWKREKLNVLAYFYETTI